MPYGIELAQAAGAQATGNTINEGFGLILANPKRKAQMRTAKQMQNLQIEGQKHMTDFNFKKQMELWEKTGYGAQVDQMKRAGINPALLYGMGSGGGQTANVESGQVGTQQAQAPQASHGSEGMGLMIGQMGLLQAQKENIEADTDLKKADAKNKGADTENKYLTNEFLMKTMEDRIDIINTDRARQIEELDIAIGNKEVERSTRMKRIEEINLRAATALIEQKLADQLTKESKARTGLIGKEGELIDSEKELIKQKIRESEQLIKYWANIMSHKWAQMDREVGAPRDEDTDFFDKLLDKIPGFIIGGKLGGKTGHTPIEGFKRK